MATWISRGMDKFLAQEFGIDPFEFCQGVSDGGMKFVSVETNIYRISYSEWTLTTMKYNLIENQPWLKMASVPFRSPVSHEVRIQDVCAHETNIYIFFTSVKKAQGDKIMEAVVPVYNTADDKWNILNVEGARDFLVHADNVTRTLQSLRVGERYLYHGYTQRNYTEGKRIPKTGPPLIFRVFNFSTQRWNSEETHFGQDITNKHLKRMFTQFNNGGTFVAGPDRDSAFFFTQVRSTATRQAFRLDFESDIWSLVAVKGEVPPVIYAAVTVGDYVYAFQLVANTDKNGTWLVTRFDPRTNEWKNVYPQGTKPVAMKPSSAPKRDLVYFLNVEKKIVLIGNGRGKNSLDLEKPTESLKFWCEPMEYHLGCYCNHCRQGKLTPHQDPDEDKQVKREAKREAEALRAADDVTPKLPLIHAEIFFELDLEDDAIVRERWKAWTRRNRIIPGPRYRFQLCVLDLEPSLQSLTLKTIAERKLDASSLPPNLHLNFNTMAAFVTDGRPGFRSLTDREREMLVHGRGKFRALVKSDLVKVGAFREDFYDRFQVQWLLERLTYPTKKGFIK